MTSFHCLYKFSFAISGPGQGQHLGERKWGGGVLWCRWGDTDDQVKSSTSLPRSKASLSWVPWVHLNTSDGLSPLTLSRYRGGCGRGSKRESLGIIANWFRIEAELSTMPLAHSSGPLSRWLTCVSCCFPSSRPKSRCVKLLTVLLGLATPSPQDFIFLVNLTSVSVTCCSPPGIFWCSVMCPEPPAFPQLVLTHWLAMQLVPLSWDHSLVKARINRAVCCHHRTGCGSVAPFDTCVGQCFQFLLGNPWDIFLCEILVSAITSKSCTINWGKSTSDMLSTF